MGLFIVRAPYKRETGKRAGLRELPAFGAAPRIRRALRARFLISLAFPSAARCLSHSLLLLRHRHRRRRRHLKPSYRYFHHLQIHHLLHIHYLHLLHLHLYHHYHHHIIIVIFFIFFLSFSFHSFRCVFLFTVIIFFFLSFKSCISSLLFRSLLSLSSRSLTSSRLSLYSPILLLQIILFIVLITYFYLHFSYHYYLLDFFLCVYCHVNSSCNTLLFYFNRNTSTAIKLNFPDEMSRGK